MIYIHKSQTILSMYSKKLQGFCSFDLAAKSRKKRKIVTTQVDRLKAEGGRLKAEGGRS